MGKSYLPAARAYSPYMDSIWLVSGCAILSCASKTICQQPTRMIDWLLALPLTPTIKHDTSWCHTVIVLMCSDRYRDTWHMALLTVRIIQNKTQSPCSDCRCTFISLTTWCKVSDLRDTSSHYSISLQHLMRHVCMFVWLAGSTWTSQSRMCCRWLKDVTFQCCTTLLHHLGVLPNLLCASCDHQKCATAFV